MPRTIRTIVAGSVRKRCARARTLIRTNSRGRSKAGRIISCRFGLKRLIRAEGLMTTILRGALRGFLIGHKSMLESDVLVNRAPEGPQTKNYVEAEPVLGEVEGCRTCPAERNSAVLGRTPPGDAINGDAV